MNDSTPDSWFGPDTVNGGWVLGNELEIKTVLASHTTPVRTNSSYMFSVTGTSYFGGDVTFGAQVASHIQPDASATYDLGSSTLRWNNIYTTDMQLSNMDKEEGNEVDGTKGDWTIQEGKDDLFLINRLSGKKYRFKLEEMKDE
jgi:hypothetical protein